MKFLLLLSYTFLSLADDVSGDAGIETLFPPVPAEIQTLSLDEMLVKAREESFAIQKALANEQAAQAAQERSRAAFLPSAQAGLAYNGDLKLLPAEEKSHRLSGTAQLWLPLVDVGNWLNFKVSKGRYDNQKTATELAARQVAYQLAGAYLQAMSLRSLLELLRSEAQAIVAQKQIASWRIRAGIGSASEELQAQMELISLQEEYSSARLSYLQQCETLGQILGADGPVAPSGQVLAVKEVIEEAAPERLELTMARQTVELAEKSLKASKFNWLPALTSTWQIGAGWPLVPESANTLALGAAVNLSIPLFDWATVAGIRDSKAALLTAQIAYREQELQLQREERLAKENMGQLATEVSLFQEQAQLAESSLTLDLADYQNGSGSALQVINTRRNHQVAQVQIIRQRYALDIARLAYWQAKGYLLEQIIQGSH